MQKITIKEVSPSSGEKKPTVIVDTNDTRMSGFESGLKDLKPGDVIEAELEVKGKFTNIKSFNFLQKASPAQAATINGKDASIDAQVAVKIGGKLIEAGIIGKEDPLGQLVLNWCTSKLEPFTRKPQQPVLPKPDSGWENLKSEAVPDIFIDLEWLHEHLKILKWADVLDYLHDKFRVAGDSVTECLGNMTKAQQDRFVQEIQSRLEKMPVDK